MKLRLIVAFISLIGVDSLKEAQLNFCEKRFHKVFECIVVVLLALIPMYFSAKL